MKKSPSSLIKFAAVLTLALGASACVLDTCNVDFSNIGASASTPANKGTAGTASCGTINAVLKGS